MPTTNPTPKTVGFTVRPSTKEVLFFDSGENIHDKQIGDIWTYIRGHQYGDSLHLICHSVEIIESWRDISYTDIPPEIKALISLIE